MKLCVLGGGGVRSPFLAKSIACNADIANLTEVVLMDNDPYKLSKYGEIAKQVANKINSKLKITLTTDVKEAVKDADFVITTLRVGNDEGRVADEQIVRKYGLLGQETTGACGFAFAMKSIPELIKYCELIKEHAKPDCYIFNFTNPSGLVTQALNSLGYNVIGICDAPSEFVKQLAEILEVEEKDFSCNCFGLNHLSWFDQFKVNDVDVTEKILNHPDLFSKSEMRIFESDILDITEGYLLNEYLYFYYYNQKAIKSIDNSLQSRAELIHSVNERMNAAMKDIDVQKQPELAFKTFFDFYGIRENAYMVNESGVKRVKEFKTITIDEYVAQPDAGGYAGVALRYIRALKTNEPVEMILSVLNNGAISELADDDVIEVSCIIDAKGAHPKKQGELPNSIMNLIKTMKEYERMACRAILNKSRKDAVMALTIHPLVANYDIAKCLVDEFIKNDECINGGKWS